MGFGSFLKKLPLVKAVKAVSSGNIGDLTDTFSFRESSPSSRLKASQQASQQDQLIKQDQQAQITQLAQQKAIASESARLQEEEARKRTLFAGTALGETSERKKLLGL
jgi:hypothetical protein